MLKNPTSRKHFIGTLAAASAAVPRSAHAATSYTMRFNVPNPITSIFGTIATHFASAVNRRSNKQINVEVYANGALASQQESIDMLGSGALDFTTQASSLLVPIAPGYQIFDLPFLVRDLAAGYKLCDSPVGAEVIAPLENHGLIGLAWAISGMKVMETTTKAIEKPEDMKGLRMRIQGGPVFVATYQALGAIPVVIDINEVFTALGQHTIDGLDVSLDSFAAGKWYTAAKHIALTNHVLAVNPMLGSKKNIEALPANLQKIIHEESRAVDVFSRTTLKQRLDDATTLVKSNGCSFSQIQYPAFRKAVEPVYALVQAKLGGNLIERANRVTGGGR